MTPTILLPRGIRNNNPGNIRHGPSVWQGQSPEGADAEFVTFVSPVYGLRALMKLLLTYHVKYGLDTVQAIVNRWAPPHENATDSYAAAVARALGVKRTQKIDLAQKPVLTAIAKAIVRHENGLPPRGHPPHWYAEDAYVRAAEMIFEKELA